MADAASVARLVESSGAGQLVVASALSGRLDAASGRPLFPVDEPLAPLLPGGGLRPGSVIAVRGSMALLLALLAAATAQGAWAAVVGVGDLGLLAAAEVGVAVQRLALVPRPGPDPGAVVAALLDGIGLVALAGAHRLPSGARRVLTARARQRGAVLLPLDQWPDADVELTCRTESWHGPESGHGRLLTRQVLIHTTGRGPAARPRRTRLHLPTTPRVSPPRTACHASAHGVSCTHARHVMPPRTACHALVPGVPCVRGHSVPSGGGPVPEAG